MSNFVQETQCIARIGGTMCKVFLNDMWSVEDVYEAFDSIGLSVPEGVDEECAESIKDDFLDRLTECGREILEDLVSDWAEDHI